MKRSHSHTKPNESSTKTPKSSNTAAKQNQCFINTNRYQFNDPNQLLIDFLHSNKLFGTKLACGEGGCGACTVILADNNHITDASSTSIRVINSCLRPMGLCRDVSILTIEGLNKEYPDRKEEQNDSKSQSESTASSQLLPSSNETVNPDSISQSESTASNQPLPSSNATVNPLSPLLRGFDHPNDLPDDQSEPVPVDVRTVLGQFNGSQCGFCSPGFAMTMRCYQKQCEINSSPMREAEIEDLFSGNLCRCTGYRSILCGFKSMANAGNGNRKERTNTPRYVVEERTGYTSGETTSDRVTIINIPIKPSSAFSTVSVSSSGMLATSSTVSKEAIFPRKRWFHPLTLSEIWEKIKIVHNASSETESFRPYKLVCGNTSIGIYKEEEWRKVFAFIDVSDVADLKIVVDLVESSNKIRFGSGVSLQQMMDTLRSNCKSTNIADSFKSSFEVVYSHMRRVAGLQVRSAGSIGGSLMMAKLHGFVSDTFLALATAKGEISIQYGQKNLIGEPIIETLPLIDRERSFMSIEVGDLLILHVDLPNLSGKEYFLRTYKVAKRFENSHALVNAGFRVDLSFKTDPFIIYGGIANKLILVTLSQKSIQVLKILLDYIARSSLGKFIALLLGDVSKQLSVLVEASLDEELDSTLNRVTVGVNLWYKYLMELITFIHPSSQNFGTLVSFNDIGRDLYTIRKAIPSSGAQEFSVNEDETPVSEPIIKIEAFDQTAGKVTYTQTLIPPDNCLHAAFVLSRESTGIIRFNIKINPIELLKAHFKRFNVTLGEKVHWYAADAIGSTNLLTTSPYQSFKEYLLAPIEVVYAGQAIGLLVMESDWMVKEGARYLASKEANFVEFEPTYVPILNIRESVKRQFVVVNQPTPGPTSNPLNNYIPVVTPTAFNIMNCDSSTNSGHVLQSIEYVSNVTESISPRTIDWKPYEKNPGEYIMVEEEHEIGSQYHFCMETQSALAHPPDSNTPPSLQLYSSTQSGMSVKTSCERLINVGKLRTDSDFITVNLKVPQVGGGFGAKEPQSRFVALGAVWAAKELKCPVRLCMDRNSDMAMFGKRHPFLGKFKLAASISTGRIEAMHINYFVDAGCTYDCSIPVLDLSILTAENAYDIKQFVVEGHLYFTNKATSTAFRSFGVIQSHQIIENALELLSDRLVLLYSTYPRPPTPSPLNSFFIRFNNFFHQNQRTPYGQELKYCNLDGVWRAIDRAMARERYCDQEQQSQEQADTPVTEQLRVTRGQQIPVIGTGYMAAEAQVENFNSTHRWNKRGLCLLPLKYGISFTSVKMNKGYCLMRLKSNGQISIDTAGIEMGQGLSTKLRQIAAYACTVRSTRVEINSFDSLTLKQQNVGLPGTGASTGTDLNGGAVLLAAKMLNEEIMKIVQMNDKSLFQRYEASGSKWYQIPINRGEKRIEEIDLWNEVVQVIKKVKGSPDTLLSSNPTDESKAPVINLITVEGNYQSPGLTEVDYGSKRGNPFYYFNYAAAYSIVEIDCLTGEFSLLQTDIIYDAGVSINPAVDIGQIEGGFVQGLGFVTTEKLEFHPKTGKLLSDGTWTYKIPCTADIPHQFNVWLYPMVADEQDVLASGREPSKRMYKNERIDPYGVQSSKTTGEPPLVLANSVFFAIRKAVQAFRYEELKDFRYFEFPSPATTFAIQQSCMAMASPLSLDLLPREDEIKEIEMEESKAGEGKGKSSAEMSEVGMEIEQSNEEIKRLESSTTVTTPASVMSIGATRTSSTVTASLNPTEKTLSGVPKSESPAFLHKLVTLLCK